MREQTRKRANGSWGRARDSFRQHPSGGGWLEDLVQLFREVFVGGLTESLRDVFLGLVHDALKVVLAYGLALVWVATGFIFLLAGILHALRDIPLSDAAAHAVVGGLALAAGGILLLWIRSTRSP